MSSTHSSEVTRCYVTAVTMQTRWSQLISSVLQLLAKTVSHVLSETMAAVIAITGIRIVVTITIINVVNTSFAIIEHASRLFGHIRLETTICEQRRER